MRGYYHGSNFVAGNYTNLQNWHSIIEHHAISAGISRSTEDGRSRGQDNSPRQQPVWVRKSSESDYNRTSNRRNRRVESTRRSIAGVCQLYCKGLARRRVHSRLILGRKRGPFNTRPESFQAALCRVGQSGDLAWPCTQSLQWERKFGVANKWDPSGTPVNPVPLAGAKIAGMASQTGTGVLSSPGPVELTRADRGAASSMEAKIIIAGMASLEKSVAGRATLGNLEPSFNSGVCYCDLSWHGQSKHYDACRRKS